MSYATMIPPTNTNSSDNKNMDNLTNMMEMGSSNNNNNNNNNNSNSSKNTISQPNITLVNSQVNSEMNGNSTLVNHHESTTNLDSNEKSGSTQNLAMAVELPRITTTTYNSNAYTASGNTADINSNNSNRGDSNGTINMQQLESDNFDKPSDTPIIELATYAETDVYECYIRGFEPNIVMRRVKDDWVNVTQVLKLAKFPKTQRSKILEREVVFMEHEKVQGGYGRFQGTWISLENTKTLVEKYDIQNKVVLAVINFVLNKDHPPQRRVKNSVLRKNSPGRRIASPSSYKKTPKKSKQNSHTKLLSTTSSFNGQKTLKATGSNSQMNPSPLHNVAFQTPRQSQMNSQNSNDTFEIDSTSKQVPGSHEPSSNSTISRLSSDGTPLPQNYSTSSQKPLQFYPVPTTLNNNNNNSNVSNNNNATNSNSNNNNKNNNNNTSRTSNAGRLPQRHNFNRNIINTAQHSKTFVDSTLTMKTNQQNSINNSMDIGNLGNVNQRPNQSSQDQIINNLKTNQHFQSNNNIIHNNPHMDINNNNNNNNNNLVHMQGQPVQPAQTYMINNSNIPLPQSNIPDQSNGINEMDYRDLILQSLTAEVKEDGSCLLPQELYHPPPNFNVNFEIDAQGHTALHWAAAMANIHLLKLLLALNSNPLYCNVKGFNAISKAIFYNNNFKCSTFQELISLLNICLVTPDKNGRSPLHYLVELSVNTSKDPNVINTYIEQILQEIGKRGINEVQRIVNQPDNAGNTVLHLCALNSNLSLFNKFYLLGVSTDIRNAEGKTALEIMSTFNPTSIIPQQELSKEFNKISTPQFVLEPEVSINMSQNDISSNKSNENDIPSSVVSQSISKGNERVHPYKFLQKRSYLNSHNNDDSYSKANSTTLTLSKDDISVLDDIITSSVIKGDRPTLSQSILQSPVVQSRLQSNEENTRFLSKFLNSPSPEKRKFKNLKPENNGKNVSKVGSRVNGLSRRLVDAINDDVSVICEQISEKENKIKTMRDDIEKYEKNYNYYCSLIGMDNIEDIKGQMTNFKTTLKQNKVVYIRSIEKSQALKLATLVQKEEEGFRQTAANPSQAGNLRDAVTLTVLQFKKHMWLKRLSEDIADPKSLNKINKYKQLIGSTYDNIDSKLDDIEADLKAAA
ncbi:regulatory protein Swi4p [Monosporozyma servazzii]